MIAEVTFDVWEVAFGLLGAAGIGGLVVALYGWRKTRVVLHRLLDLLDTLGEQERQLTARLAEFHREGDDV